jgi:hypothetical protein
MLARNWMPTYTNVDSKFNDVIKHERGSSECWASIEERPEAQPCIYLQGPKFYPRTEAAMQEIAVDRGKLMIQTKQLAIKPNKSARQNLKCIRHP